MAFKLGVGTSEAFRIRNTIILVPVMGMLGFILRDGMVERERKLPLYQMIYEYRSLARGAIRANRRRAVQGLPPVHVPSWVEFRESRGYLADLDNYFAEKEVLREEAENQPGNEQEENEADGQQ